MKDNPQGTSRRRLLADTAQCTAAALVGAGLAVPAAIASTGSGATTRGQQRLSLAKLQAWEEMRVGMFIHFGISTYLGTDRPDWHEPAKTYAPDRLDVDGWVSAARDAGMKYAVLTAKHQAGHCLWPSRHSRYTVEQSGNTTDVVEQFVKACEKRGVRPGLYYCSWDNAHQFGSRTPSVPNAGPFVKPADYTRVENGELVHPDKPGALCSYTSSIYQDFVTAQMTELLTQYGPIAEIWIDIPGVLGRGFRTFLYQHITTIQPETVVVTNSGLNNGEPYRVAYAWPADVIGVELRMPPAPAHRAWRMVEGREYYMPCELCQSLCGSWFFMPNDPPRPEAELAELIDTCRARKTSLLLNVPPDPHGVMRPEYVSALAKLGKTLAR